MDQHERVPFDRALQPARAAAYPAGEFAGQESFMQASEIVALAVQAGIGPGVSVLDLCCGVAGPGLLITRQLGCGYVGVDGSAAAIELARKRAAGLDCRFEVAEVPPVPAGRYDVVLLLETMLAFPQKKPLLGDVAATLQVGGRFAFTLEEGSPLTESERAVMPGADTVWLMPLAEMHALLDQAGLRLRWQADCTASHAAMARALLDAYTADSRAIAGQVGPEALHDLLAAHRLWADWLQRGRVRKFAIVADRP